MRSGAVRVWVESRRTKGAALTALDLQRAVLLVQRVSPQVHHTGSGGGDPECKAETRDCGDYWRFSRTTETRQSWSSPPPLPSISPHIYIIRPVSLLKLSVTWKRVYCSASPPKDGLQWKTINTSYKIYSIRYGRGVDAHFSVDITWRKTIASDCSGILKRGRTVKFNGCPWTSCGFLKVNLENCLCLII